MSKMAAVVTKSGNRRYFISNLKDIPNGDSNLLR
jgi:hypothetical protein